MAALAQGNLTVSAGSPKIICVGDSTSIGGFPSASGGMFPYRYSWAPASGLNDATIANPTAFPAITTTYTLTVTDAATPNDKQTSTVTVTVGQIPVLKLIQDTVIQQGTIAKLHASGGFYYYWRAIPFDTTLLFANTAYAEAGPSDTTIYYVQARDITGSCSSPVDSVIVYVIPNNKVVLYNTFTPNNDGINDEWYIGNIDKYPGNHLEIYNRYGKLVFEADNYNNTWNGMSLFGEVLPAATYFYILNLGNGQGVYHGTVTIVN